MSSPERRFAPLSPGGRAPWGGPAALVRAVLIGSAALFVVAWWLRDALPPPATLAPSVFVEPDQRPADRAPFQTTVGGITYTVRPLFAYDLDGLVVSKHDADTWWDWIHAAANDKLNVTDLCVVWGANARSGVYRKMDFSSGEFVCYAETASRAVWAAFDPTSLSNNHLLTRSCSAATRCGEPCSGCRRARSGRPSSRGSRCRSGPRVESAR